MSHPSSKKQALKNKKRLFVVGIIFAVLLLDQLLKIWVKTHMHLNEDLSLFTFQEGGPAWARLHFIENEGMAFGMELGGAYGKLALSLFRIVAVGFLTWFLHRLIQKGYGFGVLLSFALIFAGALGNIIDSAFYGLLFEESPHHSHKVAAYNPSNAYGTFLHGKVVDMFYFPLFEFRWPSWMPWVGGDNFQFFRPVFNLADSAITVGVAVLLLFNRDFFNSDEEETPETKEEETPAIDEMPEGVDVDLDTDKGSLS